MRVKMHDTEQQVHHSEEVLEVDISRIMVNPFQPRKKFDDREIEELAESIKSIGIIQPPIVRIIEGTKTFELVAGERRLQASRIAGLKKISVIVRGWDDLQSAQAALVENVQRVNLNPMEIAKALRNLVGEYEFSQEELARRIGRKRSTVSNYLRLLGLPRNIQESLLNNLITMGHAKAILSLENSEKREDLHREILMKKLTVRKSEEIAAERGNKPKKVGDKVKECDPYFEDVEGNLRQRLGTKVSIMNNGKSGKISIEYYSLDDLDRLLSLLGN